MKNRLSHTILIGLLLIATLAFTSRLMAQSASVYYQETRLSGGLWQYDYTVLNEANPATQAGYNIFDVAFSIDPQAAFNVNSLPRNWSAIPDYGVIETVSNNLGLPPIGSDIAPGTRLSGFSLTLDYQAGSTPIQIQFNNPANPSSPIVFNSMTQNAVPAPSALTTILIGAVPYIMICMRRKSNR